MTLLELVVRWLRYRGGEAAPSGSNVRIGLAGSDPVAPLLGEHFTLASLPADAAMPPGVEPVYPGSRITDLLAGDTEQASGIAVTVAPPGRGDGAPCFIFSFRAVFSTDARVERLIRFALTDEGKHTPIPAEAAPPLVAAGDGEAWRDAVQGLFPAAREIALAEARREMVELEAEAQRRLYRSIRRLAAFYGRQQATPADDELAAEYARRLADEVERHRLRVDLTLIGVMVLI
jgi:hypothetical protein